MSETFGASLKGGSADGRRGEGLRIGMIAWLALVVGPALGTLCAGAEATGEGIDRPADFTVTTEVLRPKERLEPIGVNRTGDPGGTNYSRNTFIRDSGNEPINQRLMARFCYRFPDGGVRIDSGTTRWNGTLRSGYLSGASVRVYRLVDKSGNKLPLRPAIGKRGYKTIDPTAADHVVFVGRTRVVPIGDKKLPMGGWVAVSKPSTSKPGLVEADLEKCRVHFTDDLDLYPGDYLFFEKRSLGIVPRTIKAAKITWYWSCKNCTPSLAYHSAAIPPEMLFPGESCLRIDGREGTCEVSQPYLFGPGTYYGPLEEGKQYRMEVWLRQKGIRGPVQFSSTRPHDGTKQFQVTDG